MSALDFHHYMKHSYLPTHGQTPAVLNFNSTTIRQARICQDLSPLSLLTKYYSMGVFKTNYSSLESRQILTILFVFIASANRRAITPSLKSITNQY